MSKPKNSRYKYYASLYGHKIPVKIMQEGEFTVKVTVTGIKYAKIGYPYGRIFGTTKDFIIDR